MKNRTLVNQTPQLIGNSVTLAGWVSSRRDHGGLIFIDLRDHTGIIQLTISPDQAESFAVAEQSRDEWVLKATGEVTSRDEKLINPNLETGKIEVKVTNLEVLNKSATPPFQIDQTEQTNEDLRLKYRFLDLRRGKMQHMLKRRHEMIKDIREYMDKHDFVEINTPILTSSSPEGARDFLVPSRLHPGKFYALPQAPQQFKQLLMASGVPKYYQIAPCFRDEDPRADRSPGEFYQLDLEMAFVQTPEEVFSEMEPLFIELTEKFAKKKVLQKPFPRIPYKEAMEKYGSDRPDLRFDMELIDLTDDFKNTEFAVFANAMKNQDGVIKAIRVRSGATLSRKQIDELTELAKTQGAGGLAYISYKGGALQSPITKFLSESEIASITTKTGATDGDLVLFGADERTIVNNVLGKLRDRVADIFELKDPNIIAWAWITEFPMYEWKADEKKIDFFHNPFCMPQGGMADLENKDPLDIIANQYDIIANGLELSSGAIRNHVPEIMYKAFEVAGLDKEVVDSKFGAMINAFKFGAPPHGGFAPGIDRMLMLLENEPNIREVIAFPKNGSAMDVMMDAPSEVSEQQLKELNIKIDKKK